MWAYVFRRLALAVPTLIGITLITFCIVRFAPGDPVKARGGGDPRAGMSARDYELHRQYLGLDLPLHMQYGRWLWRTIRLDFGRSMRDGRSVNEMIAQRLPDTLMLVGVAMFLAFCVSVMIGVVSAVGRRWMDGGITVGLSLIYAVPNYVLAAILISALTVKRDWFASLGQTSAEYGELSIGKKVVDLIRHNTLIVMCLAAPLIAYQSRVIRSSLRDVLSAEFVRTARAKGLNPAAVLRRHGLRHALIPMVTMVGNLLPGVVSGSVILEFMFHWPGVGMLYYDAVSARDYPVLMALAVITAVVVLVGTLLVDLSYVLIDPRIRYRGGRKA
jgi:peptide/nickel transport system permease protein